MFICYDEEHREMDADIEIAIPVVGLVSLDNSRIEVRTLLGGRFLSVLHTGSYPGVEKVYERLFAWMNENRLVPTGPSRELYLNDPAEVPEEELLTEVQIPVQGISPSP